MEIKNHFFIIINFYQLNAVIIPILLMRKLRLEELSNSFHS